MRYTLIADDNSTTTACLQRILKKSGHVVRVVNNGLDALRLVGEEHFDSVLVGAAMPGIDGHVLAAKAIGVNPSTQVVFLTGFAAAAMSMSGKPSRPFHIRDMGRKLAALWHDGTHEAAGEQKNGTVVYADFTAGKTGGARKRS